MHGHRYLVGKGDRDPALLGRAQWFLGEGRCWALGIRGALHLEEPFLGLLPGISLDVVYIVLCFLWGRVPPGNIDLAVLVASVVHRFLLPIIVQKVVTIS